jgi:hypothetical protein
LAFEEAMQASGPVDGTPARAFGRWDGFYRGITHQLEQTDDTADKAEPRPRVARQIARQLHTCKELHVLDDMHTLALDALHRPR